MKKNRFSLSNLFNSKRFVFALSLILAIALWVTVSPNRDKDISKVVNITTENSSAESLGLKIFDGANQNISVTVSGKWYAISDLNENDIRISYSLSEVMSAGSYDITVTASKVNNSADYDIVSVSPERVRVTVDFSLVSPFTIEVKTNNLQAADGYIADVPVIETGFQTIDIEGPLSVVNSIADVVAEINVDSPLKTSTSYSSTLKFLDASGNEVDTSMLTLPFTEVSVTVPINKSKTVPIVATFSDVPEYYVDNPLKYTLSRDEVTITGPEEIIDTISSITLDPISFSKLGPGNNQFSFPINLPSGVSMIDDIGNIDVTVDTSSMTMSSVDVVNFTGVNGTGKTSSIVTTKRTVQIVGPSSVMSSLKSSDVYLEYDLSTVSDSSGEIIVNCTVKSTKYNNIWGFGSYSVQIKLS